MVEYEIRGRISAMFGKEPWLESFIFKLIANECNPVYSY